MTDDLDPSRLLASAALDDEVDADERARVAASPDLSREVETYRSIASELRDVEVPDGARESAIAAALGVFDELRAGATVATTNATGASVVSMQSRRQRQYLWFGRIAGGAAAAALVAIVGVAVLNSGSGEDKKSSATVVLEQSASTASKSAPAADASLSSTASATAGGATDTTAGTEAADTAVAETAAAADDPWAAAPAFTTPEQLQAFAAGLPAPPSSAAGAATTAATTAASTAGTAAPAPVTLAACAPTDGAAFVPVFYSGQRVYLLRDDAAGLLRVIDPLTCAEIFSVPIP